ncbi:polysaccharide pyruvyl transferase family protein [Verrucomicrobia bacterium]|nr:polysaccharide pyruvyl transferase family protein [Verrucomicrobiota bacterium]
MTKKVRSANKKQIMKNIFITGLTSTTEGGMQFHNLGNYIITEPLFHLLRKGFPDAKISTSIQLEKSFYNKYDLTQLTNERFFTYGKKTAQKTVIDIIHILLWKITKSKKFLSTPLLSELNKSDLIIDFSGDIYGDNANWRRFIESNMRLLFSLILGKKVAMIIGSPGPFKSYWRLIIAKYILPKLSLITNREELSTKMLSYIGISGKNIVTTACPSILFRKDDQNDLKNSSDYKNIFSDKRPIIGLIICGWNMPDGPYNKWPRTKESFNSFVSLILRLNSSFDHRICIMSHQNATDKEGSLCAGNDHKILNEIVNEVRKKTDNDKIFTLKGHYTAGQSKTIIGQFDILISGRIHGAVQGLSQNIPTIILDYGHEPKAHKMLGFALMYNMNIYLCQPNDNIKIIKCAKEILENHEIINDKLKRRTQEVKLLAESNIDLIKKHCLQ